MVRRKDVARLAGVSPAVVSYVLNGGPRPVASATRERVLDAIDQLGYRPNGIAQALRMRRTMTLGLVVPDTSNPYFAELARAVEEAAFHHGYTLFIGNATEDETRQTTYVRTFIQRQVDGLLLVPAHGRHQQLTELAAAATPWVVLDRHIPGLRDVSEVVVQNRKGGRTATEHLLEHGRRRIGCIAGPRDVVPAAERAAGWRQALKHAGLDVTQMPVRHVPFGRRAGYQAARALLSASEVDGLFVASDEQAFGVLRAITDLGLRCPDDVALVSFDGIPGAAYTRPALTTMTQPFAEIGRQGITNLLERMVDPDRSACRSVLPVALTRGGSCGCPDPEPTGAA